MYTNVSNSFLNKIAQPSRHFTARFYDGSTLLDLEILHIDVTTGTCGGSNLAVGCAFAGYIEVTARTTSTSLEGKELKLELGLQLDDSSYEYIPFGYWTVQKPTIQQDIMVFTGVDRMASKFNDDYTSSLTYPATISSVLSELATATGVTINCSLQTTVQLPVKIQDMSQRGALAVIANCLLACAWVDRNGQVQFTAYGNTSTQATVDYDYVKQQPSMDEQATEISGVKVYTVDGQTDTYITSGTAHMIETSNVYMTQTMLDSVDDNIVGLEYNGGTVSFMGNPLLDPSDTITFNDGTDDFYVPCMEIRQSFDGGLLTNVSAPGSFEVTESTIQTGAITQELERRAKATAKAQETADDAMETASAAATAASNANTLATSKGKIFFQATEPSSGMQTNDMWMDTDGGNSLYQYNGSSWVLKQLGQGSIAAGSITANEIYGNTLSAISADLGTVTAGILTSSDWDFDYDTPGTIYATAGMRISLNDKYIRTPNFAVINGNLYARNGTFSGSVTANTGEIGPFTIGTNFLRGGSMDITCDGSYIGTTITINAIDDSDTHYHNIESMVTGDSMTIYARKSQSHTWNAIATVWGRHTYDNEVVGELQVAYFPSTATAPTMTGFIMAKSTGIRLTTDIGSSPAYLDLTSTGVTITNGSLSVSGDITSATWKGNTVGVAYGGTGATSLASGAALIGNGTGAIGTRSITNNTSKTYIAYNTNLMTTNTLAYWDGSYDSSGNSNISYLASGCRANGAFWAWGNVYSKMSNYTRGTAPSSAIYRGFEFKDSADTRLGVFEVGELADGNAELHMYLSTPDNTTNLNQHGIILKKTSAGALSCTIQGATTVSGSVTATGTFYRKLSSYTRGTAPSSAQYGSYCFVDKDGNDISYIQQAIWTNGNHALRFCIDTPSSGGGSTPALVLEKNASAVITCSIAGNTTVTGSISSYINSATSTAVSARNSVGHVQLYMASNGNMGVYSATDSKYLIYKDSNGQGYISFPIQLTGALQTSGNINIYNNSANSYAVGVQNSLGKVQLYMQSNGNMGVYDGTNSRYIIYEDTDGKLNMPRIYANTTTSAANVVVLTSSGTMYRYSSSSKRYKKNIKPLDDWKRVLDIPVVSFVYREGYIGKDDQRYGLSIPGFIAEDVEEHYGIAAEKPEGRAEDWNIRYIVPPMLAVEQDHEKRIAELETELKRLKGIVA